MEIMYLRHGFLQILNLNSYKAVNKLRNTCFCPFLPTR